MREMNGAVARERKKSGNDCAKAIMKKMRLRWMLRKRGSLRSKRCYTVQYSTALYCTVQHCTVRYSTVLYGTVVFVTAHTCKYISCGQSKIVRSMHCTESKMRNVVERKGSTKKMKNSVDYEIINANEVDIKFRSIENNHI